jgi:hypothetical protein
LTLLGFAWSATACSGGTNIPDHELLRDGGYEPGELVPPPPPRPAAPHEVRPALGADPLAAWQTRRPLVVTNAGVAHVDQQIRVSLQSSAGWSPTWPSDVRVTLADGATAVPFWVERVTEAATTLWVRVPSLPVGDTKLWLYYGEPKAPSAADGAATFAFFDDFEGAAPTNEYFALTPAETVLVKSGWEPQAPHTLSVVPVADSNGTAYIGYYGLQGCGGIGIARSKDLSHWDKDPAPLFSGGGERWPWVLAQDGVFTMVHTTNYCGASYIVLRTSTDGTTFTAPITLVEQEVGLRNQNPNLFRDPATGTYFLYYYHGDDKTRWQIRVRSAARPEDLATAKDVVLIDRPTAIAAPQMFFWGGDYYLAVETFEGGSWLVRMFVGSTPTGGLHELPGNPLLGDGAACFFQHAFGATLHAFYCKRTGSVWTLEHRTADLSAARSSVRSFAADRWTASGGRWQPVSAPQRDGTVGTVMQGATVQRQILSASFAGDDYVLEANVRGLAGAAFGLGVGAIDSANLISATLYDNPTGANNVSARLWQHAVATEIGSSAQNTLSPGDWHKLAVRVHGTQVVVALDDENATVSENAVSAPGGVALYGEANTTAQFDDVRVRQIALPEPTVTVGDAVSHGP